VTQAAFEEGNAEVNDIGRGFQEVDEAADAAHFVDYLRTASAMEAIAAGKQARDGLLGLSPGGRVLEVGCGLGDDARRLLQLVGEEGSVVGLDSSAELLKEARANNPGVDWRDGDAHELSFPDQSFDAVRTERTLQHVETPERVLGEMVRVVRPGGVVLACEPDWGTVAISGDRQDLVDVVGTGAEAMIRHPRVGRALPAMLIDAGLSDVRVGVEALPIRDFDLLNALGDLPTITARAAEEGLASASDLDELIDAFKEDAESGRLFATVTLVTAWGARST
jgi:SAM-dependent methyltransferase